jgi:hypothetical protein
MRFVTCTGKRLLLFDAISEDAQRKSLSRRHGLFFRRPVSHHSGHVHNLGNPAPVGLKFCLHFVYNMRHARILARSQFAALETPQPIQHVMLYLEAAHASHSCSLHRLRPHGSFAPNSILIRF